VAENRLLDTNVLVYAYDVSEKRRREIAKVLVDEVWDSGGGVVSLQNLSEFFFAVTRKVQKPIPVVDAKTIVADILRSSRWVVIDRNAGTLMKAMDIVETVRAPFWDALIAACMLEHGIEVIVTENEKDFRNIPGVTVVNPFRARGANS
jgi:predicted nucleic acid-binding protein